MIPYIVKKTLKLGGGRIGLTPAQATRRKTCLRPIDFRKGLYEIEAPVEFKVGETIGLDEVPKTVNPYLETSEDAAAVAENKLASLEKELKQSRATAAAAEKRLAAFEKELNEAVAAANAAAPDDLKAAEDAAETLAETAAAEAAKVQAPTKAPGKKN